MPRVLVRSHEAIEQRVRLVVTSREASERVRSALSASHPLASTLSPISRARYLRAAVEREAWPEVMRLLESAVPSSAMTAAELAIVRGLAARALEDWAEASARFEDALLVTEGPMRAFVAFWALEASAAQADLPRVQTLLTLVRAVAPHLWLLEEAEALALHAELAHAPDPSAALVRSAEFIRRFPAYPRPDRLLLDRCAALLRVGRPHEAGRLLEARLWEAPWRPLAPQMRTLLAEAEEAGHRVREPSVDARLERARELRRRRHWAIADDVLRALEADPEAELKLGEIRTERMLTAYASGDFVLATALAERLAREGGATLGRRSLLLHWVRSKSRLPGQIGEAWALAQALHRQESTHFPASVLYEVAYDLGYFEEAWTLAQRTQGRGWGTTFPGLFLRYLANDRAAAEGLASLASRSRGDEGDRARYWAGRAYAAQGRWSDAEELWRALSARGSASYYTLQAGNRLRDLEHARAEGPLQRRPPERRTDGRLDRRDVLPGNDRPARLHLGDREHGVALDYGASIAGAKPLRVPVGWHSLEGLESFVAAWERDFPEARLALGLLRIGMRDDAQRVFREVVAEHRALARHRGAMEGVVRLDERVGRRWIDNRRQRRGRWGESLDRPRFPSPLLGLTDAEHAERQRRLRAASASLDAALVQAWTSLREPHFMRREALRDGSMGERDLWIYGVPWASAMLEESAGHDLNPWLLWGLMIVESDLNPDSISVADAFGLLQMIPTTGELMSLRIGERDFGIEQLLAPRESIRFGMAYFEELMRKFHGQEALAIASYNAGPHQVERWLHWRGDVLALDELLETLPFRATRRYTRRILRLTVKYGELYAGWDQTYLGNRLVLEPLDNINF